jgi:hypothetical protein
LARERQTHKRGIDGSVGEPGGGVGPHGLTHLDFPVGAPTGELGDDLLRGLVGGAGGVSDAQKVGCPAGRSSGFPHGLVPAAEQDRHPLRYGLTCSVSAIPARERGEGLREAVADVDAVIHAATNSPALKPPSAEVLPSPLGRNGWSVGRWRSDPKLIQKKEIE